MARILLSRLSAMGDVAMLIPLAYEVARTNPEHHFTFLTQPFLASLLVNAPRNLEAMAIDTKQGEKSLWGLLRYAGKLREEGFDVVVDLHDVMRTKVLRWACRCGGAKVLHLRKPRAERRKLLASRGDGELRPVTPMIELYRRTLLEAGLRLPERIAPLPIIPLEAESRGLPLVGIAPFASTDSKTYDLSLMQELVARLSEGGRCELILFGGRGREQATLEEWAGLYPRTRSVSGRLDFEDELRLMASLRCMLSMDSANMHLASAVGTRVLSLWCATHPSAGFLGMGQSVEDCLHDEGMDCRPCTIFGKVSHCPKGDMPCRRSIRPEELERRVLATLV